MNTGVLCCPLAADPCQARVSSGRSVGGEEEAWDCQLHGENLRFAVALRAAFAVDRIGERHRTRLSAAERCPHAESRVGKRRWDALQPDVNSSRLLNEWYRVRGNAIIVCKQLILFSHVYCATHCCMHTVRHTRRFFQQRTLRGWGNAGRGVSILTHYLRPT